MNSPELRMVTLLGTEKELATVLTAVGSRFGPLRHTSTSLLAEKYLSTTPAACPTPPPRAWGPEAQLKRYDDFPGEPAASPHDTSSLDPSKSPRNYPSESKSSTERYETSEDATSHSTSASRTGKIPLFLLGNNAEEVMRQMVWVFRRHIDIVFRRAHREHAPASGEPGPRDPSSYSRGFRSDVARGKKRRRPTRGGNEGDQEGEPNDEEEGGDASTNCLEKGEPPKQMIACPYIKRYPVEFSTWRTCPGPGFSGMNRLKEHLRRRHFEELVCGRCGLKLGTSEAMQEHIRAEDPCPLLDIQPEMGFMTQLQHDVIHGKGLNRMSVGEKWRAIYKALFPEADEASIPGPYFDMIETSKSVWDQVDPQEYETYLGQHLPRRISIKLDEEFKILAEHAKQRLMEIVQTESVETFRGYLQSKGMCSVPLAGEGVLDVYADDDAVHADDTAPGLGAGLMESMDMISQPAPGLGPSEFDSLWPSGSMTGQEDSAYGSEFVNWCGTADARGEAREWQ